MEDCKSFSSLNYRFQIERYIFSERLVGCILGDPGAVSRVAGIFVGESLL